MYYKLTENKEPIRCSVEEWSAQFESSFKHVGKDIVNGKVISTVWLGINHNHFGGTPYLFETMVFEDNLDDIHTRRYSTWEKAEEGHKEAIEWVKRGCK